MAQFAFDRFTFDATEQVLIDADRRVPLPAIEAALLRVLLESRGATVSRAQLLNRAWPGVHVSPETVTRQMSRLRARLGDTGRRPRLVSTVARRGYRLLVPVHRNGTPAASPRLATDRLLPLAVLPLTHEAAPLADLAHGLTERLIDRLSRLPRMRVVGLSSVLMVGGMSPADALTRLGASSSLTGRVRAMGTSLELSLELCGADGVRMWASREQVSRRKPHLLEGRVLRRLAAWLSPSDPAPVATAPTMSGAAYTYLMTGTRLARHMQSLSQLEGALGYLTEAVRIDPALAPAHLALADAHLKRRLLGESNEAGREAKRALDTVLTLDPACAQAIAMRGVLVEELEWDHQTAREAVRRADALAPHDPVTQFWCACFHDRLGEFSESMAHLDKAQAVDPLSMDLLLERLSSLVRSGQYLAVRRHMKATTPLIPGGHPIFTVLGAYADAATGHRKRANDTAAKLLSAPHSEPVVLLWAVMTHARAGYLAAAREGLGLLERRRRTSYISPYFMSVAYACVGRREEALTWFERAETERAQHILYGTTVPGFESIARTKRFRDVLRRIGLLSARPARPDSVRKMSDRSRRTRA